MSEKFGGEREGGKGRKSYPQFPGVASTGQKVMCKHTHTQPKIPPFALKRANARNASLETI